MSKTLTKHVKTCFRSQNWPGRPGWFTSSRAENLSKIVINSSGLQMRRSFYTFFNQLNKRNAMVQSNFGNRLGQFWLGQPEKKNYFLRPGSN